MVLDYSTRTRLRLRRVHRAAIAVGAGLLVLLGALLLWSPRPPHPTYLATEAYRDARGIAAALRQYSSAHGCLPPRLEDTHYRPDRRFQWHYLGAKGEPLDTVVYCRIGGDGFVLVFVDDELTAQSESYQPWVKSMLPNLRAVQKGFSDDTH